MLCQLTNYKVICQFTCYSKKLNLFKQKQEKLRLCLVISIFNNLLVNMFTIFTK